MLDRENFSLRELRAMANISQEELGKAVELSGRTIAAYEKDAKYFARNVSYETLKKIAEVLDVSVDNIFLG